MKNALALFCILVGIGFAATLLNAQQQSDAAKPAPAMSATPLPEPEWVGQICLLSEDGKLVLLETQKPQVVTKIKALGFGSGTSAFVYKGEASTTRTRRSPVFVMKILEGSQDPTLLILLNQMQVDKGVRQIIFEKVGAIYRPSGGYSSVNPNDSLPFNFAKYGSSSVKVVPSSPLAPGEYAFRTRSGISYLFGVDK